MRNLLSLKTGAPICSLKKKPQEIITNISSVPDVLSLTINSEFCLAFIHTFSNTFFLASCWGQQVPIIFWMSMNRHVLPAEGFPATLRYQNLRLHPQQPPALTKVTHHNIAYLCLFIPVKVLPVIILELEDLSIYKPGGKCFVSSYWYQFSY